MGRAEKKYGGSQPGRFVRLSAPPPRLSRDNQRRLDCSPTREDDVTLNLGKKRENPGVQSTVTSGDVNIQHLARKENSPSVPQPEVSLSAPANKAEEPLDLSLPTRERARLGLDLVTSQDSSEGEGEKNQEKVNKKHKSILSSAIPTIPMEEKSIPATRTH